jgi:hypothetical protein
MLKPFLEYSTALTTPREKVSALRSFIFSSRKLKKFFSVSN